MAASFSHLPQALKTARGQTYDDHGDDGAAMVEGGFRGTIPILVDEALPALQGAAESLPPVALPRTSAVAPACAR